VIAIRAVVRAENGIKPLRLIEARLHVRGGNAHPIARLMTGGATAAIRAKALKKWARLVNIAILAESSDHATWVRETGKIGYHRLALLRMGEGNRVQ
jgi:hypothetical protein